MTTLLLMMENWCAATPTPMGEFGFHMQDEAGMTPRSYGLDESQPGGNLPAIKPEDAQYFGKLLTEVKVRYRCDIRMLRCSSEVYISAVSG